MFESLIALLFVHSKSLDIKINIFFLDFWSSMHSVLLAFSIYSLFILITDELVDKTAGLYCWSSNI